MQALLDQGGYDMPQRGDIREGTVISVSPQEVVIDLGLKREAIVPANDLSRLDKATLAEVQEGTTWPVYILQPSDREGNLIVSLSRALQEKDWLVAQEKMDNNEMFEARVTGHNAGGLEVEFGKLRGFVPASHLSSLPREMSADDRKAQLATYVGKTIPVKVVEVDRKRRRLIMSERAARRRWQREHRKQLLDEIQVGEVRTGTVRSLSEFGAFVDLGGADGLVHISELAWFPVAHPSEVLKIGQQVDVKVLRIDKQRERVGLSLKRVQPDPWSHIDELYQANQLVEAVVTRVTDFGAFVRLRSGVEGLLHVSEMADIRPDHPQSLVSPGDLLLLRVLRIEPDRRRIGLSLRQVSESEWSEWAASYREKQAAAAEEAAAEAAAAETDVEAFASDEVAQAEMDQFAMVADDLALEEEAEDAAEAEVEGAVEAVAEPKTLSGEESSLPEGEVEDAAEAVAEPKTLSGEESSLPEGEAEDAVEAVAEPKTLSGEESSLPEGEAEDAVEAVAEPKTLSGEESSLPEGEAEDAVEAVAEPKTLSGEESSLPEGEAEEEAPAEPKTLSGEESGMPDGAEGEQSNA
jgi:small subunit ribosomal protein S1